MVIKNIKDLDETGNEMKVLWKKANNFFTNFTMKYLKAREELTNGEYGSDWNINRFLLTRVGISDKTVLDVLTAYKRSYAGDEREKIETLNKERTAAKRAEKHQEKVEKALAAEQRRQERVAAEEAKKAAAEVKEFEKAQKEAQQAREAKNERQRKRRAAKRFEETGVKPKSRKKLRRAKLSPDKTTHISKNNGNGNGTTLSALAEQLCALRERERTSREEWIEVQLAIAGVLKQAKEYCGSNLDFSEWLNKNGFDEWLGRDDRAAYIYIGGDLAAARSHMEQSISWSIQRIEEEIKNHVRNATNTTIESDIAEQNQGDSVH